MAHPFSSPPRPLQLFVFGPSAKCLGASKNSGPIIAPRCPRIPSRRGMGLSMWPRRRSSGCGPTSFILAA
eukprot:3122584-Pyramimonas_sp.AAC.1